MHEGKAFACWLDQDELRGGSHEHAIRMILNITINIDLIMGTSTFSISCNISITRMTTLTISNHSTMTLTNHITSTITFAINDTITKTITLTMSSTMTVAVTNDVTIAV